MNDVHQRVCSILSRVLSVPVGQIDAESSPDTLENWDSIHHLQIVLALEEECDVEFSIDEVSALQSVGAIVEILRERQGSA